MANTKRNKTRRSAIIRALNSFADKMAEKARGSLIARLFSGYFAVEKKLSSSFSSELAERRNPVRDGLSSLRNGVCRVFTESPLKNRITAFLSDLMYARTADIGIYLFASGLYAVVEYIIIKFAIVSRDLDVAVLYGGAGLMLLSMFFFSGRSLCNTIHKRSFLSFIVFDLIGADRNRLKKGDVRIKNASSALLLGMITGVLAFLFPPHRVLLLIVCLIVLCAVFFTPESGAVLTLAFVPFLPLRELLILCAATTVSYVLKTVRRKRELRFGPLDISVMIMSALILFGKLISIRSASGTDSVYLLAAAAYFICRNLLCKREWLERALHAAAISSAAASLFGLLFYFCGTPSRMIAARSLFAGAGGEMSVFFSSSYALACYLILTSPLLLFFALNSAQRKAGYYLAYAASVASLCLTGRIYAVISAAVSLFIVLAVYNRRSVSVLAATAPAVVLAALFLPGRFYDGVYAKLYGENAVIGGVWRGVGRMIAASPFGGTGIGSFADVYPVYAQRGFASADGAKNVYLQLTAEGGVTLSLMFVVSLFLTVSFCLTCLLKCGKSAGKANIYAPLAAIVSIALYGITENVFGSPVICMMTFAVMGICAASSELCRREYDYGISVIDNPEV